MEFAELKFFFLCIQYCCLIPYVLKTLAVRITVGCVLIKHNNVFYTRDKLFTHTHARIFLFIYIHNIQRKLVSNSICNFEKY